MVGTSISLHYAVLQYSAVRLSVLALAVDIHVFARRHLNTKSVKEHCFVFAENPAIWIIQKEYRDGWPEDFVQRH